MKRNRIVLIGLDACDPDLIIRWSREGKLPFLASKMESGVCTKLDSTKGLFSDSPWPSFYSGVSPANHAFYNYLQIKRGTMEIERINAHYCRFLPFWYCLKNSAKKVVAIDVPKTFPLEGLNGVQICAWGEHYPLLNKPSSKPTDSIENIIEQFGGYPHPEEIITPKSIRQEKNINNTLISNLEKKLKATEFLLDQEEWDLFISVFSEGHYSGHQFYHLYNEEHWAYEPGHPTELKNALPNLYSRLDKALQSLSQKLDEDTTFIIFTVHGIETNYSANHLMDEILIKLGYQSTATEVNQASGFGNLLKYTRLFRELIPDSVKDYINENIVPTSVHDRAMSNEFCTTKDWSNTKAFLLPSDHFDAFLSINLKGREPFGIVERGGEFEQLCGEISNELKRLTNPKTGRPAVHDVVRISDVYEGPYLNELPDLVVQWADVLPTDEIHHPSFGTIPNKDFEMRKTKHSSDGLIIADGKNINKSSSLTRASTLDLAPTILYLLGQPIPDEMDGTVLLNLIDEDFKRDNEPVYNNTLSLITEITEKKKATG